MRCAACPHPEARCAAGEWKRRASDPILLVLGQNPGKMEANLGRAFMGPSGDLLRRGVKDWPGGIYVENAIGCRPIDIKLTVAEVEACLPHLVDVLQEIKPSMILSLGEHAASAIVRLRDMGLLEGIPVVQHSHPAMTLGKGSGVRQGSWVQSCQAALVKMMYPASEIEVQPLDIHTRLPMLLGADAEYFSQAVWQGSDIWSVSDGERAWVAAPPSQALKGMILGRTVVFHHAVNELVALRGMGISWPEALHDTMVLAALDDEEGPRDLKVLAATKLNYVYDTPRVKEMQQDLRTAVYCAHDSRASLRLFNETYQQLSKESWLYSTLYRPIIPILADMSFRGLRIDKAGALSRREQVEARLTSVDEELATYKEISWGSDDEVAQYMVEQGHPLGKETAKGTRPSVDKESLLPLARKGVKEAELVLERRSLTKIKSTYLKPIIESPDDFLRTVLNPVGAETGRISSGGSRQKGMTNLQNIPDGEWNLAKRKYGLRDLFLPPEGMVWVEADCSQHEVRVLAWLAERDLDKRPLSSAVAGSVDFYRYVGQAYLGDELTDEERAAFKTVVLAGQYLARPGTLQRHLEMDGIFMEKDKIENMMAFVDSQFPTIRWWHEKLFAEARETGQITTPLGRRRRVFVGRDGMLTPDTRRIIVNSPVQGTASDLVLLGLLRAHQARLLPLLTVHDSIDVAAYPNEVREVAETLHRCIVNEPLLGEFPILAAKVKAGPSWGQLEVML